MSNGKILTIEKQKGTNKTTYIFVTHALSARLHDDY